MALKDIGERLEGKGWLGIGIGAVILAPIVIPVVSRGMRPVVKGAIKGYLAMSEKARELFAEAGEQFQDLVAEAKSEYDLRDNGAEMMTLDAADGHETASAPPAEPNSSHRPRARARKSTQPRHDTA